MGERQEAEREGERGGVSGRGEKDEREYRFGDWRRREGRRERGMRGRKTGERERGEIGETG